MFRRIASYAASLGLAAHLCGCAPIDLDKAVEDARSVRFYEMGDTGIHERSSIVALSFVLSDEWNLDDFKALASNLEYSKPGPHKTMVDPCLVVVDLGDGKDLHFLLFCSALRLQIVGRSGYYHARNNIALQLIRDGCKLCPCSYIDLTW